MSSDTHAPAPNIAVHSLDPQASMNKKLRHAVQYAVLAPSSHNSQPWHFIVDDDSITLCADRMRALPVVDPFDRELTISCGAALFNLRTALNHYGLGYRITLFPSQVDPDMLAHVQVSERGYQDESLAPLFNAIPGRATVRKAFSSTPVADNVRHSLIEAGETEGAQILCIDDAVKRSRLADLIAEADALQFADPCFRRELACWIHPKRSSDGMPADAAGVAALLNLAVPIAASAIRTFDIGEGMAAMHHKLLAGSPLLLVVATDSDIREAWLAAGQALERLLLSATRHGLTASYLNQPIEIAPLRERLRASAGLNAIPQLLLRIGYGPQIAERAPRRPLSDVLW
ncbi:Acg family FMN-binding oxidoreductase [Trinickia dinghuensis]|uniref:Nitroreductase n=1 Tax=Trinickia dinghuensis TaxID=2291023 RepID=A0A3D8K2T1_9BURK|nr:nitroreductase family protein [Trinickia dinghuensis]RDU99362.1 nitroreductase [Trinickia dinghuensis]